ncbi:MAG: hypothetical protein HGB11_01175 [Chlorobiales bacterium]|nr:hypothetical protein [Chlorobiales bacterium]
MKRIWLLIKFFSEEKHANDFLQGKLFLNRLSHFRKQEEAYSEGRSDLTEAIKMWFQPFDIHMSLSVPEIGTIKITPEDLAAPVSVSRTGTDYLHIFCMYAIYTDVPQSSDITDEEYRQKHLQEIKQKLIIDDRCIKFGSFAVIIPAHQFINQVQQQLQRQGYKFQAKLVDYYDDKSFSGEIPDVDVPFMKQVRFEYQSEFRITVDPRVLSSDPITIDVGPLDNALAKKGDSSVLIANLKNAVIQGLIFDRK